MILLLAALPLVLICFLCQKRKSKLVRKKIGDDAGYSQEILQAKVDVQNSILRQTGKELHDHIGQLLSVAHISLNMLKETKQPDENQGYIIQADEMVSRSITDLRVIAENLNGDFAAHFNLADSLSTELARIQKMAKLSTGMLISGNKYSLGYEKEIVLFSISQEILNNIKKHSKANDIFVELRYATNRFVLILSDNGVGFESNSVEREHAGGLAGMARRAVTIGGNFKIRSTPGKGTTIEILLPVDHS